MICKRCIRQLFLCRHFPRWNVPIGPATFHINSSQCTKSYSSNTKPFFVQSPLIDDLPSLLDTLDSDTTSVSETLTVQTEKVEITQANSNIPLVSRPLEPFGSKSKFFQYKDQRTSSNNRVLSTYTTSTVQANFLLSQIKGPVIGMDLEWRSQSKMNVSLVQICDEDQVLLIHICKMKGFTLLEPPNVYPE
jgi:hypothetical protein